jgi:hypothetical protein
MKTNPKSSPAGVNYEQLGKTVEDALISDYIYLLHSTKRQIWSSFVRGTFAGLGGVVGATIGVAILVAILHQFGGAPVIGHYFQNAGDTIQSHNTAKP